MAKGLITDATLTGIADAIREKTGTSAAMRPDEMATLIQSISGGGKVAWGSFTPRLSTTTSVDITHNLGVVPNLIAVFIQSNLQTKNRMAVLSRMPGATYINEGYFSSSLNYIVGTIIENNEANIALVFPTLTTTTMTVKSNAIMPTTIYFDTYEYIWIAAEVSV